MEIAIAKDIKAIGRILTVKTISLFLKNWANQSFK